MKPLIGALAAVALTAAIATTTAAAQKSSASAEAAKRPIVIGLPTGQTGFVNFYDGPLTLGAKFAVSEINKRGGVLGRPLKLVIADTKSDLAQGTNAALRVIGQGAQFVIPTMDYDFGGAAARAANAKGIIAITTAGDPRFGRKGIGPYVFNLYQAGPTEGAAAAQFAVNVKKWKRVYVLEDTSADHPKTVCDSFTKSWRKLTGSSPVGADIFQNSDQSIDTQITRIRGAGSLDAIMLCSYAPGGVSAIRQIRAAGITAPLILDNAFDGTYWLDAIPDETNTYVMSTGVLPPAVDPNKTRRDLFRLYKQKTGQDPVFSTGLLTGYSAVQAIAAAVTMAKTTASKSVKAKLETFRNYPLAIGPTTWTPRCHVPLGRAFAVIQIVNRVERYVATVKPKYVPPSVC